jgi:hypothetical protein
LHEPFKRRAHRRRKTYWIEHSTRNEPIAGGKWVGKEPGSDVHDQWIKCRTFLGLKDFCDGSGVERMAREPVNGLRRHPDQLTVSKGLREELDVFLRGFQDAS